MKTESIIEKIFVIIIISFSFISFANLEVVSEPFPPEEDDPFPVYETEQVETQLFDNETRSLIYYDIYGRAYRVEEFFFFNYTGLVEYDYYPKTIRVEVEDGFDYLNVVMEERGVFSQNGEVISTYNITYAKDGSQTSFESEGFDILLPIFILLADLYGYDTSEIEDVPIGS